MVVTINTDASFSHKHQVGAYAFWIVSNEFKIKMSGPLRKKIKSATQAECMAIMNALHMMFQNDTSRVHLVVINTDSMNAKHVFENDEKAIRKYSLKTYSQQFYGRYGLMKTQNIPWTQKVEFQFRHVKAHQDVDTPRTYINDWCDKEAKKHIKIKIDELDLKKQKRWTKQ